MGLDDGAADTGLASSPPPSRQTAETPLQDTIGGGFHKVNGGFAASFI
jgi:hypothetical protein